MDEYESGPKREITVSIPALAADAATIEYPIFYAPYNCKIKKVSVLPQAAVTGNDTNRKDLNLKDKGLTGGGTTAIGNKDMMTGVNFVAFQEFVIYSPAAGLEYALDAGEVMSLEIEDVAVSPAFPVFAVIVEWFGCK